MTEILHISDVHLSQTNYRDFQFVKDALLRDLADEKTIPKPDIVCFSGDLVHAGGKDDDFYIAHEQLIEPVLKQLGVPPNRFFIVPGNHDIDRDEVRNNAIVEDGQFSSLSTREKLNGFIDQFLVGADIAFNFRRLSNYFEFHDLINDALHIRKTPFFCTSTLDINGVSLGIACLNSAWRCTGEEGRDYGRLLIGERAVTEASSDIASCDIRIAMMHHPLGWLREFDREDCRPLLMRDFDLILTGHTHRQSPEWQETPMGRAVFSEGGALYVSRRWFNGYCSIRFDTRGQQCEFTLRRYEDEPKKFSAATNVSQDGRFFVQLRGPEELERYVSVENILQQMRPLWEETAIQHIVASYANLPTGKSIEELYIPVELSARSDLALAGAEVADPTRLAAADDAVHEIDIVNAKKSILIFGRRESGKTTLAYYLGHLAASGQAKQLKIPIYIDLSFVKFGTDYVEKATRIFLRRAGIEIDVDEYLQKGAFCFLIDNFESSHRDAAVRAKKQKMVEAFLARFPQNKFILLADLIDEETVRIGAKPKYEFDRDTYYLQPLTRNRIRSLAQSRLKKTGVGTRRDVDAILKQLDRAALPKTPYIVLMLITVMERDKTLGQINEAVLLERFIEAILQKASSSELDRGTIDYTLKDAFLAHLAHRLVAHQNETVIDKNDLVTFTVEFFRSRSWPHDASSFLTQLIRVGILYEGETEDGIKVAFRYGCLREFYLARYFQKLTAASWNKLYLMIGPWTISVKLNLFTGLTRNETAESVVSDEEVDKVMDLVERMPDQAAKPQELAGKLLRPSDEFESVEERELANYFGLISVLSAW